MAKKKYKSLRPYQTVVQAKKPELLSPEEEQPSAGGPSGTSRPTEAQSAPTPALPVVPTASAEPVDPKQRRMQELAAKLQEKTDKEISLILRTLNSERSLAAAYTRIDLDNAIRSRILALIEEADKEGKGRRKAPKKADDENLGKFGVTFGVLRRLGFSEERVLECLTAIPSVELEDALDWLYLYCSEDELSNPKEK
ncbi:hypothetical protein FRB90_011844, partial [Tulasnella sp. 427]